MRAILCLLIATIGLVAQTRSEQLIAAVKSALPFPAASAGGDVPADHSAAAKWFVVWPVAAEAASIVVRANPLHPEVQRAGAEAMKRINAAVAAADRRAQAAYDQALAELRRSGRASDLESIRLDDEGVAGERIDAELELLIEWQMVTSFEVGSSEPPLVTAGSKGPRWMLAIPANTYRGADQREHFRAAEARLYFGAVNKPEVLQQNDEPLFRVTVSPSSEGFAIVLRGNEALLEQVIGTADWSQLTHR